MALQPVPPSAARRLVPISLSRAVEEFCDQDASKQALLGRVAQRIVGAAYGGGVGAAPQIIYFDEFAALKAFVEHVEGDFAFADFTVPDVGVDQVHSRDESHFRDQEKR